MFNKLPFENYFKRRQEKYLEYLKSERWQKLKEEKLKQVGYKCQICGSSYRLQVHHKRYDNLGSESLWDLRVLCDNHHKETHYELAEELAELAEERQRKYEEQIWKDRQEWENKFLNKVLFNIFLILSLPFVGICMTFEKLIKFFKRETVEESKQKHFFTETDIVVSGIKYSENIEEIKNSKEGTSVLLIREEDNPYDWNAIKVCDEQGKKWGYIPRDLAFWLSYFMDHDKETKIQAKIKRIYTIEEEIAVILHLTVSVLKTFHNSSWEWDWKQHWKMLIDEIEEWKARTMERESAIQNYKHGLEKEGKGLFREAEKSFKKAEEILDPERHEINYRLGLEEFDKKNWEKVIDLLEKIHPNSPYYSDVQQKLKEAHKKIEEWRNLIRKIELLNYEARKLKQEIKYAFSSISDDGAGSGVLEKERKLEVLQQKEKLLLRRVEKIYPIKTKEIKEQIEDKMEDKKEIPGEETTQWGWRTLTTELTGLEVIGPHLAGRYFGKKMILEGIITDIYESPNKVLYLNIKTPYPNYRSYPGVIGIILSKNRSKFPVIADLRYRERLMRLMRINRLIRIKGLIKKNSWKTNNSFK